MSNDGMSVTGGKGGVTAGLTDMRLLADHSKETSDQWQAVVRDAHAVMVDDVFGFSMVLDPQGFDAVQSTLLPALDGPQGLAPLTGKLSDRCQTIQYAASAYEEQDRLGKQMMRAAAYLDGTFFDLPCAGVLLLQTRTEMVSHPGLAPGDALQSVIASNPEYVDHFAASGPGLMDAVGRAGFRSLIGPQAPRDVPGVAGVLAGLYPDGEAELTPVVDPASSGTLDPTRDPYLKRPGDTRGPIERITAGLNSTNDASHMADPAKNKQDTQGTITVRTVTGRDGVTRYIVDLPGTKDWHATPGEHDQVNDLGTNLHGVAGDSTAYQKGVAKALAAAGAPPGAEVLVDGHSQGGIIAAQIAHNTNSKDFPYKVTHVITAASPTGNITIPPDVKVLHIVNHNDAVPRVDGAKDPDAPNRTTVTFSRNTGKAGDNHSMSDSYAPIGEKLDKSTDPSVVDFRESLDPYVNGTTTTSQRARIGRKNH